MNRFLNKISENLMAYLLVISAIALAIAGIPNWGWLLVIAFLIYN